MKKDGSSPTKDSAEEFFSRVRTHAAMLDRDESIPSEITIEDSGDKGSTPTTQAGMATKAGTPTSAQSHRA
jgi:hypothetical protein